MFLRFVLRGLMALGLVGVLALSAVTNVCDPDQLTSTSGEAVVAAAESTEPKMRDIVTGVLRTLDN